MKILNFHKYEFKRYSYPLIIIVLLLSSIGAYLIKQVEKPGENLFIKQLLGLGVGLFIILVVSLIDYHFICKFYIVLYFINLALLLMVRLLGREIYGAKRWLDIGFMFQPSELSKIITILFFAKLFSILGKKINNIFVLLAVLLVMMIPTMLVLTQTDLSTSMVLMFIFVMILFTAELSWKIILPVFIIGIPVLLGLFWYIQQDYQVLITPNQQKRVLSLLHPEEYPEIFHQQDNSVQAIGSGQLMGKLLTEGPEGPRGYDYVPISESDFIFSVAAEEFGFLGSCIILLLFSILVFICLATARKAHDSMGKMIAVGVASMFMFQVFVNIGVTTAILPNTGLPLPFLSSGLSSLLSSMISIGLILNIRIHPDKPTR